MKERPILFSGPMVRAILEGRKTQTRRVVTPQPEFCGGTGEEKDVAKWGIHSMDQSPRFSEVGSWNCPFGVPGDRLWVRETTCIAPKRFATPDDTCVTDYDGDKRYISYKADGHSEEAMRDYGLKWTPSIHMPRWASRLTLEITAVRVERLQDIRDEDAKAEGVMPDNGLRWNQVGYTPREVFRYLWNGIYQSWDANPWVWVVEFRKVEEKR